MTVSHFLAVLLVGLWLPGAAAAFAGAVAQWLALHEELPAGSFLRLAEDDHGMLWIAGERGLLRYDGLEFVAEPAFAGQRVHDLAWHDGALWLVTADALWRKRGAVPERVAAIGLALADPVRLHLRGGSAWLGHPQGLLHWLPGMSTLQPVAGLSRGVYLVQDDGAATLRLGTRDGLLRLDPDSATVSAAPVAAGLVFDAAAAARGGLWLGGYQVRRLAADGTVQAPEGPAFVRVLRELANGELWVGTHGDGLWRRLPDGRWLQGDARLQGELITALHEDRQGNVWVATDAGALHQFGLGPLADLELGRQVRGRLYSALAGDGQGKLYVARYGVGLVQVGSDGSVQELDNPCGADLRTLLFEAPSRLWIGSSTALCWLDGRRSGRFDLGSEVNAIVPQGAGYWLSLQHAVGYWDGRVLQRRLGPEQGLRSGPILHLAPRADGEVWIGSAGGLQRSRGARVDAPLHAGPVRALQTAADGGLWALSGRELLRVGAAGRLARLQLPDDYWMLVPAPADDGLWLFGRSSVLRYPLAALQRALDHGQPAPRSRRLGRADGIEPLREIDIAGPTQLLLPDGRHALAGYGRLLLGHLRAPPERPAPPLLLQVHAGSTAVAPGASLAGAPALRFDYRQARFRDAARLHFRHRLLPLQPDWSEPAPLRQQQYAALPPARYRFEVQALDADAARATATAAFEFALEPGLLQRSDVRLALLLLALALLAVLAVALARWRLALMQRRQDLLQAMVAERTRQLAAANQQLDRLARTDALTGLANRRSFTEQADRLWAEAHQAGSPIGLALLDVDHFKAFNDHYGHAEGDRCLQAIAAALDSARVEPAVLARYGGEEFVVLLPGCTLEQASRQAEALRAAVQALALPHLRNSAAPVATVSIGVAVDPAATAAWPLLLQQADAALYRAKHGGRNRVEQGSPATP